MPKNFIQIGRFLINIDQITCMDLGDTEIVNGEEVPAIKIFFSTTDGMKVMAVAFVGEERAQIEQFFAVEWIDINARS